MRVDDRILPTPERLAKPDMALEETERGGREARSYGRPLAFYFRKGIITGPQFEAGEMLHKVWYFGCASAHVQMRYGEDHSTGGERFYTPPGFLAVQYRNAMLAIRGVAERRTAYKACCDEEYVGRGNPILLLRSALDDLDKHFPRKTNVRLD